MRGVVNGKLYDTEISECIHETGYEVPYSSPASGWHGQALYLSPNGAYFAVAYYPHCGPSFTVFGEDWIYKRQGVDEIDQVIKWLEWHRGAEVILERWPERLQAG